MGRRCEWGGVADPHLAGTREPRIGAPSAAHANGSPGGSHRLRRLVSAVAGDRGGPRHRQRVTMLRWRPSPPSGLGWPRPASRPARYGVTTTSSFPPGSAPCATRATHASGCARSCRRTVPRLLPRSAPRPRTTAVAVLPSDAAIAKVMGHRRKATTVDLYGHLRDVDFRSVTDAVAADLAAARPDPTPGVTLGVKTVTAVRNPKHRRRSEG